MAATPQERLALGVAALLLAAGAAARAFGPGAPPAELTGPATAEASVSKLTADVGQAVASQERRKKPLAPGEKIDVNTASAEELDRIVGTGVAQKIVDYRTSIGRFTTIEQLDSVPGVGPATLEKLRPAVTLGAAAGVVSARPSFQSAASVADWDRTPQKAPRERSASSTGTVDLNTASVAELTSLPGIGEALAERIVAWRQENGGFRSVDQLLDVSGIGPAKLQALRPRVRATP